MTNRVAELADYSMWIGGGAKKAASGAVLEVIEPATGQPFATVPEADAADVDLAVRLARSSRPAWSRKSPAERATVLDRFAKLLREKLDELVSLEVRQTGRPIREMSAQLARLPEWYEYFGAVARTDESSVPPYGEPYLNYTRRLPLGVVGLVTPWNHPLLILTKKLAPALAAGNSVVVKPSELAPLTPILLGELFKEAGIPDGIYNVVTGYGNKAGKSLVAHPDLAKVDLTGGTETGKAVAAIAGSNLTKVAAELGGKAPVVVFDDIGVERAVSASLFASFVATGQTCVQGARLLVHDSIYDEFVTKLSERTKGIVLGDPQDPGTQFGPLISQAQLERVEEYVKIGIEEGATLVSGGQRAHLDSPLDSGFYFSPTIFVDVTSEMRIAQEEIFGPVTCVIPFHDEAEAIALANGTDFGLAASIWTRDLARAHRVAAELEVGVVWINDHHRIDPSSPWGGFKSSGIGRENGIEAYRSYTEVQSIVVNFSDDSFDWYVEDVRGKRYS